MKKGLIKMITMKEAEDRLAKIQAWHQQELTTTLEILLDGVPDTGNHPVTRETLEELIITAFLGGVTEQMMCPYQDVKKP